MEFEQKILSFEEAIRHGVKRVWIQMRETEAALPVAYALEHSPFLRFKNETLYLMIYVRAAYYGKTWRCFRKEPDRFDLARDWEDADDES